MDTMGSPSWEERLSMVDRLVMERLLAFLDPPEGLRVTAKKGTPEYDQQRTRQRNFWNELGQAVARELPAGANRHEIEGMLTDAVNECVASRSYRVWPGIGEVAAPLRQHVRDWWGRQRANEASKRALPAPKVDPLTGFRDHGWTVESAERWIKELERDVNHPFQKSMIGMAQAALERCQARRDGSAELRHQRENFFPDSDRHADERRRSIERAEGEPHDWKDQGDAA